ncbi:hypothetical protein [Metasolibacillus sp.]|uniref:hypothetical protein n=1 Tax=Metasolibacillus sp. TaxID=2703680 RepID=UPI0025FD4F6B|nr:hypothetical protein [Metasolibacillus sp.]MCT6925286.1 hypothetical protein [Metasolibacillus sp.]MCT6941484.1 hypothetical protein [Metasolibacillus sp.]
MKRPYQNVFPSLKALYEQYAVPYEQIVYEDKPYKFIRTKYKANMHIDIYRHKEEQHTVEIYLVGKRPYYINTYYQVSVLHAIV